MTDLPNADQGAVPGAGLEVLAAVPDTYANATAIYISQYETLLRFSQEAPDLEGRSVHRLVSQVRLPHGQAWVVAHLLIRQLEEFARQGGRFNVPPDLLDRLDLRAKYDELIELASNAR
jgi:hypothetical protein